MNEAWDRRLHRFTGSALLGLFLVEHLLTNASALGGEPLYERIVGAIERSPVLPLVELVLVVAPLSLHVIIGMKLVRRGHDAATEGRYRDPRLLLLQRISAVVLLVFVLGHLWELRLQRLFFGLGKDSLYTTLTAHLSWTWGSVPWLAFGYLVGLAAAAFHFANGLLASLRAARPASGRGARIFAIGLGVALFAIGTVTVVGLATGTRLLGAAGADSAPCGAGKPSP